MTPSGYGIMVYDPDPERRTVVYEGKNILMAASVFDELESFVDDGIRFVKIEGTLWAPK